MINKFEILPNEIFLKIFSYLSWDEILISLWSLNERINSIICSIFSSNKTGIILNDSTMSYKKFSKMLLPLIFGSSSLISNIKYIHFNGIDSIPFDFVYPEIFSDNDKNSIYFPNLKSLNITNCILYQPLIDILSLLIKHRLNQLTLTFHADLYKTFTSQLKHSSLLSDQGKYFIEKIDFFIRYRNLSSVQFRHVDASANYQ